MYEKKNLSPPSPLKNKKLSQTLRAYNSQVHETTLLKFGIWSAEGGAHAVEFKPAISTPKGYTSLTVHPLLSSLITFHNFYLKSTQ